MSLNRVFLLDGVCLPHFRSGRQFRKIYNKDARVWWSSEWIGRSNAVILCRLEYHTKVAMIAASQGGCGGTCVGFEFIFEMV